MATSTLFRFKDLPSEIRIIIWGHVAFDPYRIVPIKYQKLILTYTLRIKPPAILQVNRESRFEGVKVYRELSLSPRPNTGCYMRLGDPHGDRVYITVDQDSSDIVASC